MGGGSTSGLKSTWREGGSGHLGPGMPDVLIHRGAEERVEANFRGELTVLQGALPPYPHSYGWPEQAVLKSSSLISSQYQSLLAPDRALPHHVCSLQT